MNLKIEIPHDILWKSLIEDIFPEFLKYYLSEAEEIFDFSRGFEFLDKELAQIFPEGDTQNRRADLLVKIYLKSGDEVWILVHIEVQGYKDEYFAERMFQYFYRIKDRYSRDVMAFAILTDDHKNYLPSEYHYKFFDTEVIYKYNFLKLSDCTPSDFQKKDNIFGIALETAWYALEKNKLKDEELYRLKFDLCRRVLKKGYKFEDFRKLFNFIKFYVSFGNQKLLTKFEIELREETNKSITKMGIEEAITSYIKETAHKIGVEEGIEEGKIISNRNAIPKLFSFGISIENIAISLDVSVDFVRQTLKEMSENN